MAGTKMEKKWLRVRNKKGSALLSAYLVITSLLILGAAFILLVTVESRTAEYQRRIATALYIADAGIERALYDLRQDIITDPSSPSWSDGMINGWVVDINDTDSDGFYPLPDTSNAANSAYASTSLSGGSYSVRIKNVSGSSDIWIRSAGTLGSVTQTIEVYASLINISPWNNAIFGGAGASGALVNGNVNIFGSVHILGDGLAPGDNAIDLGGTAELVGNNYAGLDSSLKALVPALPTIVLGGETVETLGAELRVKNGLVGLSGNSAVGQANATGNAYKETVDGAYVTDGYNGTAGTGNVYSDNGSTEGYDLGDAVSFPSLSNPYPDNPGQDYYEYFADNALVLTTELASVTPSSNLNLGDCSSNCVYMNADGNLQVEGMVYVSGTNNLALTSGDFTYSGKGTILVTGDVTIDANLITSGAESFPTNILGVMTPNDISLGASSQKDIMGLFFAEGEVTANKQTDVLGTLLTNYFDLSNQVPSIYQVPETVNNLPPGMIAGDAIWLMKVISWKKI